MPIYGHQQAPWKLAVLSHLPQMRGEWVGLRVDSPPLYLGLPLPPVPGSHFLTLREMVREQGSLQEWDTVPLFQLHLESHSDSAVISSQAFLVYLQEAGNHWARGRDRWGRGGPSTYVWFDQLLLLALYFHMYIYTVYIYIYIDTHLHMKVPH